jgi:hypothetical protein
LIEVLPATPPSLEKGSIHEMVAQTFARFDKLARDIKTRTVDITITSSNWKACGGNCGRQAIPDKRRNEGNEIMPMCPGTFQALACCAGAYL